ncbi:NCS2 family permease [Cloacibacillus sp.]
MESYATDLLTALAVVMNGVPQGLLSLSLGFAAFPTAIAFLIGAAGSFAFNSVATISFQAETIAVAGKLGSTPRERMSLVFWGALFLLIPSSLGLNEKIVEVIGPVIVNAMMAGVGVMLALVSIDMLEAEKYSGISSMVVALATWFITFDLAKTVIISVIAATIVFNIMKKYGKVEAQDLCVDESRERLTLGNIEWKIWKYPKILVSGLALACLNIGANISFGKITDSIANTSANIDHLAIYSSLADMGSTFFGGGPVEAIISGTATAPHPVGASILMMLIMAAILFFKLLPVLGRYVHSSAISGLLFVLGVFVTFISNIQAAISLAPAAQGPFGFSPWGMAIGATVIVSARWNPFYGLLAGVAIKLIFGL